MPSAGERSHYQVLGVSPTASSDEIRRAHRQLARILHPDRQSAAPPAERALAERRMREVNAAWTTLSDPAKRAAYDRRRSPESNTARPSARRSSSSPWTGATESHENAVTDPWARPGDPDDEPDLSAGQFWLLRRGPVIVMVAVGLFLFVVTAYAGGNAVGDIEGAAEVATTTRAVPTRPCVRRVEGRTAVLVDCAVANDGRLVTLVDQALDCPARTSYVVLDGRFACVTKDPTVTSDGVPTTTD